MLDQRFSLVGEIWLRPVRLIRQWLIPSLTYIVPGERGLTQGRLLGQRAQGSFLAGCRAERGHYQPKAVSLPRLRGKSMGICNKDAHTPPLHCQIGEIISSLKELKL